MKTKILKIENDIIYFENGLKLYSHHDSDCCESHELSFKDIKEEDWKDLEFDLSNDSFFTRIPDYGIQLNATNNFPLRIPGYGYNNGYYSDHLDLILTDDKDFNKQYDITECQEIQE